MLPDHKDGQYHGGIEDDLAEGGARLVVRVVSPQGEVFAGRANWIVAPGADGSFGVWPRHVPLVAALSSGMMRIGLPDHEVVEYLVRGSFLSVRNNVVTVLIDESMTSSEGVDTDAVQARLEEVAGELSGRLDDAEYLRLLDEREWCRARLRFVERKPDWVPKNV